MKNERLLSAFGQIDDRYIFAASPPEKASETKNPAAAAKKRFSFLPRPAIMAAVFTAFVLLAVPVRAEIANGYVSNLLAPLYGGAQTELVDQIGVPVDASATVGDYRLSAEAVIGDNYNVAIVYSLTRTDGGPLEEGIGFENFDTTMRRGSGGGFHSFHMNQDKTVLSIVEAWRSSNRLFRKRITRVTFSDLVRLDPETREKTLLQAGDWELHFTLRYKVSSVTIPAKDTLVKDAAGRDYLIHKIELSPIGIHLNITAPNFPSDTSDRIRQYQDFTLAVVLEDGTAIALPDFNLATHGKSAAATQKGTIGAMFEQPLALEKIAEIVICGTPFRPET